LAVWYNKTQHSISSWLRQYTPINTINCSFLGRFTMISLRELALVSLAAGLASADGLAARAKADGKLYWGTAINPTVLSDSIAKAIGTNSEDFASFTCENEMKWDATEPSQNVFTYTNADLIVSQAASTGQSLRCHNLVWHSQLPSWGKTYHSRHSQYSHPLATSHSLPLAVCSPGLLDPNSLLFLALRLLTVDLPPQSRAATLTMTP
jgi:hypothetical protein